MEQEIQIWIQEMNRMKINPHTMYRIISRMDSNKNSSVKNLLFYILFK